MKEAGIFSQEFSRNPKKWLVLGGLAVFRSLCELAFLGLLRDKAAQLLGQPSHLQLDSLLAAFLLLLVLAMRFIAQKAYLRSSLRMQGDFRENKEYLFEGESLWVERREKQRLLDLAFEAAQWHVYSWVHLVVFLPALLFNNLNLFIAFLICFTPILWVGRQLRSVIKSHAIEFSLERKEIFCKLDQSLRFANQWTHFEIQRKVKHKTSEWLRQWSVSEMRYRDQNETSQLKLELLNSVAFVMVITLCILGAQREYFDSTSIIFFVTAILLSYEPLKKIQTYQNTQIQSRVELQSSLDQAHQSNILGGQIGSHKGGIQFLELQVGYHDALQSCKINAYIDPGIHLIQGDNGAGKSTLIQAILGSFPSKIVSLHQFPILPPSEMLQSFWAGVSHELKSHFQLDLDLKDQDFSGGESQKILLLIALSQSSPWYIFDEPLSNVDLAHRKEWIELMLKWAQRQQLNMIVIHHESSDQFSQFSQLNHWQLDSEALTPC